MEQRPVSGYVYIGTAIRYLMECRPGTPKDGRGYVLDNIAGLDRRLMQYELHVTRRVLNGIFQTASEWRDESQPGDGVDDVRRLTEEEAESLRECASVGRETLLAEAAGKVAYVAEDKRYTVEKLTSEVHSLFASGVFDQLPEIAQGDFRSAGRAIAFMLPTAGAFHILRGSESALRDYYSRFVRRGRIPEPRMWGAIVADLKKKSTAPPELLVTSLDSLRKHYRNPTQHPEKIYDIDEVQDLLAGSIDVVNQMYRNLSDLKR